VIGWLQAQAVKLLGGALILSLLTLGPGLLITRAKLADARTTITALEKWQDDAVIAVRLAADAPTTKDTAVAQITALGNARRDLAAAVAAQNAAVASLRAESEAALAVADRARKERAAAVKRTEALVAKLRARPPAEDTDAAVRRSQDELYEAGL
jgi:BMFP domain-containing protein YqiC